ncbi:hypothetical protein 010DV004_131 [Bacillus phage 010DV004]|nr:hypothetical protein 010DV004_131 [Bacillus phage 010DV004]QZA69348.1 hypothetical protein 010DV005_131 [Bacillus phage 010DV005]QZA69916.1 hypothetical protein 043JT007_130 [Bacillus phage 043JT007]
MFKEKKVTVFDSEVIKAGNLITLDEYTLNIEGYSCDEDYKISYDYTGSITGLITHASESRFSVATLDTSTYGATRLHTVSINETVEGDIVPDNTSIRFFYRIVGVTDRLEGVSISKKG